MLIQDNVGNIQSFQIEDNEEFTYGCYNSYVQDDELNPNVLVLSFCGNVIMKNLNKINNNECRNHFNKVFKRFINL